MCDGPRGRSEERGEAKRTLSWGGERGNAVIGLLFTEPAHTGQRKTQLLFTMCKTPVLAFRKTTVKIQYAFIQNTTYHQ